MSNVYSLLISTWLLETGEREDHCPAGMSEERRRPKPSPDPFATLRGHAGSLTTMCFGQIPQCDPEGKPPGDVLLSGTTNGEIFVWSLRSLRVVFRAPTVLHGGKQIVWLATYKEHRVLSQGKDGFLRMWTFLLPDSIQELMAIPVANVTFCQCSLLEGSTLVAAPTDAMSLLAVIDLEDGNTVSQFGHKTEDRVGMCTCLKFVGAEHVACGYESGDILLWKWRERKVTASLRCYEEPITCLEYHGSNRQLLCASVTDTLQVWKLSLPDATAERIKDVKVTNPGINAMDIRLTDGRLVATGGRDARVRVFGWRTLKPLAVLCWHQEPVHAVRFSPSQIGRYGVVLASGAKDGGIALWSLYNETK